MLQLLSDKELRIWWERRRVKFNLILVCAGTMLLLMLWLVNKASINIWIFPLVISYFLGMNILYLFCWLSLILLKRRYSINLYNYSRFFFDFFVIISMLISIIFAINIYLKFEYVLYHN
jgi:hypothetical protein